jgi:hypothetical protein
MKTAFGVPLRRTRKGSAFPVCSRDPCRSPPRKVGVLTSKPRHDRTCALPPFLLRIPPLSGMHAPPMAGGADDPILVAPYDPRWPVLFQEERVRVESAIGNFVEEIERSKNSRLRSSPPNAHSWSLWPPSPIGSSGRRFDAFTNPSRDMLMSKTTLLMRTSLRTLVSIVGRPRSWSSSCPRAPGCGR